METTQERAVEGDLAGEILLNASLLMGALGGLNSLAQYCQDERFGYVLTAKIATSAVLLAGVPLYYAFKR